MYYFQFPENMKHLKSSFSLDLLGKLVINIFIDNCKIQRQRIVALLKKYLMECISIQLMGKHGRGSQRKKAIFFLKICDFFLRSQDFIAILFIKNIEIHLIITLALFLPLPNLKDSS